MARTWLRWMPAVVVPVLIASGAVIVPMAANAAVALPEKSAQQVLSLMASEKVTAFSASVSQVADFGVPAVPAFGRLSDSSGSAEAATSVLSLLTGTHTARLYVAGQSKMRIQIMDSLAERDLIHNGADIWLYNSANRSALHSTAARGSKTGHAPAHGQTTPPDLPVPLAAGSKIVSPDTLAVELLRETRSSTTVAVGSSVRVAGRTAYSLTVAPKTPGSLISRISIAVDSASGMPLRVQIFALGQKTAAFSVAFTSLTLATPDNSLFAFTPPAGTTVTERVLPIDAHRSAPVHNLSSGQRVIRPGDGLDNPPAGGPANGVKVLGAGWASIISIPANMAKNQLTTLMASPLAAKLSTAVVGGRAFHTSLFSVLVTTDGRIFAGSVPVDRLRATAALQ